jgi:PAS domain S-box-containing protein
MEPEEGRSQSDPGADFREALMLAAINEAPFGIVLIDVERMTYVDMNEAAARLVGMSREEALARGLQETRVTSMEWLREEYARLIAQSPQPSTHTHEFHSPVDGSLKVVEATRRAVRIHGRWLIVGISRDITDAHAEHQRLQRLQAAINEADDAISIVDPERLEYLDVNEAASRMRGLGREEMRALGPVGMLLHTAGRGNEVGTPEAEAPIRRMLKERYDDLIARYPEAVVVERTIRAVDGSERRVESVRRAFRSFGRWLVILVNRDVSARHAANQRLEMFRAAIDQAPDAIVLIDPEKLAFLGVNEAACRLYGKSRDELVAEGVSAILQRASFTTIERPSFTTPELLRGHYDQVIAAFPEPLTNVGELSLPGQAPRTMEWSRRAVRIDDRWMVISIARDITKERAERQRLHRLQAAMNQAADAIFVADPETLQYLDANEAGGRLLGLSRQEVLAEGPLGVARRFSGRVEPQVRAIYRDLIAAYPAAVTELQVQRTGQPRRVVEWTRRAVQVENRWLIISIARDVTDRVRVQEELKQRMEDLARSNRDLEQFAYVTSHDLSEPLRMIASYTQLLERRYSEHFDADAREFMGYITGGAQRMRQLIDDLLTYSRAGRREVRTAPICLDEPLGEALANLAKAIADSGATIERPRVLPTISCDRSGMMQLFQNLVGNALKFRGTEPLVVRIDVQDEDDGWTISVRDNGIGIEPKYFERIFVIFQRLHARTAYEGTGIGLAICKRIVERHGGHIWVESEPGRGSAFRFFLPFVHDEAGNAEPAAA